MNGELTAREIYCKSKVTNNSDVQDSQKLGSVRLDARSGTQDLSRLRSHGVLRGIEVTVARASRKAHPSDDPSDGSERSPPRRCRPRPP
eukprot:871739-Pyramimonas_sp.AAC.1